MKAQSIRRVSSSHATAATILIRVLVGAVFLSEGIQKFSSAEVSATIRSS